VRTSCSSLVSSRRAGAAWWALVGIMLCLWPASAAASAGFDAARAHASKSSGRSLNWTHDLGSGPNRVLIVSVTIEDNQDRDPGAVVTFNGTPLLPVPGGLAVADAGHGFLRTQLFYLLDATLPPAGTYPISIRLAQTVHEIGGASISLVGLAQAPPEAVATSTKPRGSDEIATPLTTLTPLAWIVEAVGADVDGALAPSGTEQMLRTSALGRSVSVAASAFPAIAAGARSLAWDLAGAGRLAHVAVAFAPLQFPVTIAVNGQGTIDPAGGLFSDGSVIDFTAIPNPGWIFGGWGGDATGAANPLALSIDGARTIVATFTPDFALSGWAATSGGTTGGEGGTEVVVDTLAALKYYAGLEGPYIIKVAGTIIGDEVVRVQSNKSILGIGSDARLLGVGLQIGWNSAFGEIRNVIIRNLTFEKAHAPIDGVFVSYGGHHVWIDHCDFFSDRDQGVDFYDGLVDITNGAEYVTVSWSRFYDHYKTSLVGSSDTSALDPGHLTVTYHHNSFINSGGRNPSVRFGLVHVFNNYYRDLDDYAIASRMNAEVVIENNWFENVSRPIRADTSLSPVAGLVRGTDTNVYVNSCCNSITGSEATWVPPYLYALDPVAIVPDVVAQWAGVGILTIEGEAPQPTAPVITMQPASQAVEVGQSVSFSVLVDGTYPFAYQWYKDGTPIGGATDTSLTLESVQVTDAGSYTVEIINVAGSVTSVPAVLTVSTGGGGGAGVFLQDSFDDGNRTNQALPGSSAWFSSSTGSTNLSVVAGDLKQIVSSSRTLLTYFTDDQGQPVTLAAGERLTLRFMFRLSGFETQSDNFRVALLQGVANPSAVSGAGFVASGPPNTNARVAGDFGSNAPTSNVFSIYKGYAAFTYAGAGVSAPIRFLARTVSNSTLLGGTGAYTSVPGGTATPSTTMEINTPYRGTLTVTRTAGGIALAYLVERVSDGAVIVSFTGLDAGSTFTAFDTVAFYLNRTNASSYDFFLSEVVVERDVP
jgi:pectate lyase